MLKKLISKIKSESSKSETTQPKNQEPCLNKPLNQYQVILKQPSTISGIKTIHYDVVKQFPNIKNLILSCSIPFNILPFSQRKVKEIDLNIANPQYIQFMIKTFEKYLYFPNHVLINHYPKGIGIMHHLDGPLYYPRVFVYSIGTAIIEFVKEGEKPKKILLQDKSIHIFEDDAYHDYLHGIENHGIDCIFCKIEFSQQGLKIINCSVMNIQETQIIKKLRKELNPNSDFQRIGNYEISKIYNNQQFNYKIQIQRTDRISITIRHKYAQIPHNQIKE